jgi:predicted nucleic acid-binding Zn ribbon protein
MTPAEQQEFERRRKSRATVTALILGALVVLIFALAIAKIKIGWAH